MTRVRPPDHHLRTEAVRVLTRAANQSRTPTNRIDFAGFLAQVLAATAANVGGPECLLAGRPGSWEASHVDALLRGTVGDDPDSWRRYHTEPIVITLNVAELIESTELHSGLLGLDDAIDTVCLRYESAGDDDEALEAWDAEIETLVNRYRAEYREYADRFTTAAQAAGEGLAPPVVVVVVLDADPTSAWWRESAIVNPTEFDADELGVAIWQAADVAVGLPNVEIRFAPPLERPTAGRK